mmetsp:Transcript_46438/g.110638  ORF Transcript_46438/g.110638 Transcript_46438/m.110638 type:complete len:232 (-) Transcript_46438:968-1663(-)
MARTRPGRSAPVGNSMSEGVSTSSSPGRKGRTRQKTRMFPLSSCTRLWSSARRLSDADSFTWSSDTRDSRDTTRASVCAVISLRSATCAMRSVFLASSSRFRSEDPVESPESVDLREHEIEPRPPPEPPFLVVFIWRYWFWRCASLSISPSVSWTEKRPLSCLRRLAFFSASPPIATRASASNPSESESLVASLPISTSLSCIAISISRVVSSAALPISMSCLLSFSHWAA